MNNETPSTGEMPPHQPTIPDEVVIPELTLIPVLVGAVLGIVFGASSLYLVLKVGITISASIPVAVISITLFRLFSKLFGVRQATILENNIVQTTGSAGESIAFGVGVTMPALMILGYEMEWVRVMTVSCLGGLLGILMMIPLRRGLIVKQHGKLTYPEGTACAQVLIVGEKGGSNAVMVFLGFIVGFIYKALASGLRLWTDTPAKILAWFKGVEIAGDFSPELLGVGYIIGPATGCIMMAGGVLSTLVLIPMIKMFGENLKTPLYPGTTLISAMNTHDIWSTYVLYIGAGAVATGGIISLFSSLPLIASSFVSGLQDMKAGNKEEAGRTVIPRTDRDLPMWMVLVGGIVLVVGIWSTPVLNVNLAGALLIIIFGFLFVTVSSRLTGEIGSSSNPISGMTVSTLLLTCLIFLLMGWTGPSYRLTALSIAAVVCIAASNGGTTSQDLKTGYLIGATPSSQQISILVGALSSAIVIGGILLKLNDAATIYAKPKVPFKFRADITALKKENKKQQLPEAERELDPKEYYVLYLNEPVADLQSGKYLVDDNGEVAYIVDPGINGTIDRRDSGYRYKDISSQHVKVDSEKLVAKEHLRGPDSKKDAGEYFVVQIDKEQNGLKPGTYMASNDGTIKYDVDRGPEVKKFSSPKAKLMSLIIDGILTMKLPWTLVIIGAFIALVLELCQVSSLPFAVGVYLPFSASVPIFIGGIIRWMVDRNSKQTAEEAESSAGVLLSSGLIAGGAIAGIFLAFLQLKEELFDRLDMSKSAAVPEFMKTDGFGALAFVVLSVFLFFVGKEWIFKPKPVEATKDV